MAMSSIQGVQDAIYALDHIVRVIKDNTIDDDNARESTIMKTPQVQQALKDLAKRPEILESLTSLANFASSTRDELERYGAKRWQGVTFSEHRDHVS